MSDRDQARVSFIIMQNFQVKMRNTVLPDIYRNFSDRGVERNDKKIASRESQSQIKYILSDNH